MVVILLMAYQYTAPEGLFFWLILAIVVDDGYTNFNHGFCQVSGEEIPFGGSQL